MTFFINSVKLNIKKRVEKIQEFIDEKKLDCLFTKNPSHIFYLTGILEIEGYLLIDKENSYLFVSPLYLYEALDNSENGKELIKLNVQELKNKSFQKFLSRYKKIGFINTEISYSSFKNLQKELVSNLIPVNDFILDLRMIKENGEIELIKKAEEITEKTFENIKNQIREGVYELEIVAEIKYQLIKNGARKESFEPIVASGVNSSYPHHKSTDKKIKNNEVIVIDMGADFLGYKSDLTYTFLFGNVDSEIRKIYQIVDETRKISIEFMKNSDLKGVEIYKKAVENFKKYNLEKFFIHGLGHGVGIDVHEKPYLNKKGLETIQNGTIFTVEPGIYIPKKFGVRIESMVFKT